MISSAKVDYSCFAAVKQGSLECDFDGFKSGIAEGGFANAESPPFERNLAQPLAKPELILSRVDIAHGVHQFGRLIRDGMVYGLVSVPMSCHCEARGQVQEPVAIDVPDIDH
jgi:hypothetical protein